MKEPKWTYEWNNKIPDSIRELMDFLANVLTVVTVVVPLIYTAIKFLLTKIGNEEKCDGFFPDINGIVWVLGGLLFFLVIRYFNQYGRYNKKIQEINRTNLEELAIISKYYQKFLDEYRNTINKIEFHYKKNERSVALFTTVVQSFVKEAVNSLSNVCSVLSEEEVCCCVKVISIKCNMRENIDYHDARVKTFVRSENSDAKRADNDVRITKKNKLGVKISENTDFISIVDVERDGNDSLFYQPDLLKYQENMRRFGKEYRNTTENWQDFYRATIVAPIREEKGRLFYVEDSNGYCVLGFLCVDSMSTNAFPTDEKEQQIYRNLIRSYAALLFNIFSKYQYILMRLEETGVVPKNTRKNKYFRALKEKQLKPDSK